MAFDTIVTVPTDGGTFNHHAKNIAFEKIDDTRTLLVYAQVNPVRIFARIITFDGVNTPTYSDAYSVVAPASFSDSYARENMTRTYLRVGFTDTNRNVAAIFFRSNISGNNPLYHDTSFSGESVAYVICDVDTVAGTVVPRSNPTSMITCYGMAYDVLSPENSSQFLTILWNYGSNVYRNVVYLSNPATSTTFNYHANTWYENAPSTMDGGIRADRHAAAAISLNNYAFFSASNSSYDLQYKRFIDYNIYNTGSNTATDFGTNSFNPNGPVKTELFNYDNIDTFAMIYREYRCVMTRYNKVYTLYTQAYSQNYSYDAVREDVLSGLGPDEQVRQCLLLGDGNSSTSKIAFLSRNRTLGGPGRVWIFDTDVASPPTFSGNPNHSFIIDNFPCDVDNGAEKDNYQGVPQSDVNNQYRNMSWNDVAQWDATNGVIRLIGCVDDGQGNPAIGVRLVSIT